MRCLGLDLGSKTLGIALSDMTNCIASVYKILMVILVRLELLKYLMMLYLLPKETTILNLRICL